VATVSACDIAHRKPVTSVAFQSVGDRNKILSQSCGFVHHARRPSTAGVNMDPAY
jgi:hypothetical protein